MRYFILGLATLLVGCETPATITPKPDIKPVIVSNQNTRASIKTTRKDIGDTRKSIKDTSTSIDKGQDKLGSVEDDLNKLLRP